MSEPAARAFMSIGEVLGQLRPEFPDITISKIRFLEAEGLIEPDRTSSGYRKFSPGDIARLRFVLAAQRDHYLPLRVIKQQLADLDRGGPAGPAGEPRAAMTLVGDPLPGPERFGPGPGEGRYSRAELLTRAHLEESQLAALEEFGLLAARPGGAPFDGDALEVAAAFVAMARHGIEARHLRAFRAAAQREVGLIEQVVAPLSGRGPTGRARAQETVRELAALSVRLHAALVNSGLPAGLAGPPGGPTPGR